MPTLPYPEIGQDQQPRQSKRVSYEPVDAFRQPSIAEIGPTWAEPSWGETAKASSDTSTVSDSSSRVETSFKEQLEKEMTDYERQADPEGADEEYEDLSVEQLAEIYAREDLAAVDEAHRNKKDMERDLQRTKAAAEATGDPNIKRVFDPFDIPYDPKTMVGEVLDVEPKRKQSVGAQSDEASDGGEPTQMPRLVEPLHIPKDAFRPKLIVYTKKGCCLCEGLIEKVEAIGKGSVDGLPRLDFDLVIRDIEEDPDWYNDYRYEIPVVKKAMGGFEFEERDIPRWSPRASVRDVHRVLIKYYDHWTQDW
eukprot:CAMPEP_0184659860 /NCGR_PEP_ID=MMETSP0308-20130426/31369_1 /TAXON_ID=38269 /ORGANISM="Gloeochaete witrockiana, Strain SAG 46.84" /LENGTH=307 /DNA_ID=CAMNT_0027099993 /DNA_START=268 /DNA_END=1188 /DNA_ORIENTATION=+